MTTPNGPGGTRIGDTERVAAATALGDHFAAGRLDQAELDDRLSRAYAARTFADLEPLFADLPEPRPTRPALGAAPVGGETPGGSMPGWAPPIAGWQPSAGQRGLVWPPTWWPGARWARRPAWQRRAPGPIQVVLALVSVLVVFAVLSLILVLLPLLLLVSAVVWFAGGGPQRRRHWQRHQPIGRPPWGGDNGAWYQFGWSSRDWSGNSGPGAKGDYRPGQPRHHRHHGRRRQRG
jgi:hypothetical protein